MPGRSLPRVPLLKGICFGSSVCSEKGARITGQLLSGAAMAAQQRPRSLNTANCARASRETAADGVISCQRTAPANQGDGQGGHSSAPAKIIAPYLFLKTSTLL